jgi:4-hydroxy-4-methyl-2-oxoglutarate aldolase
LPGARPGPRLARAIMKGALMSQEDSALLERFGALETGQLSDVLDEAGLPNRVLSNAIRPLGGASRMVGIALCARGEPIVQTQERLQRPLDADALDGAIAPGSIVLIETGGFTAGSCVGGLMAYSFKRSGCAGLVVDGAVRDSAEIEALGLTTWCRGRTPVNGSRRWALIEVGAPIRLPGVAGPLVVVTPGDYVVADEDGVVVIPAAAAASIVADAEELARIEGRIAEELRVGGRRGEVFKRNRRFDHIRAVV